MVRLQADVVALMRVEGFVYDRKLRKQKRKVLEI